MIDYSKSQLYIIKDRSNGKIVHIGGTISNLKRRYWNHKSQKDTLYKYVVNHNLDWNRLSIHHLKEYSCCHSRYDLRCVCVLLADLLDDNKYDVFDYVLENLDNI